MDKSAFFLTAQGKDILVRVCNTVVVGSGAAGYSAAGRLHQHGVTDLLLVTEGANRGTSRNTGSDKQTYYKLTLSGAEPDSVGEMAQTLFAGQCMDGDTALCEAAQSAQGFMRLVEAGVPFPQNSYGEFVGYKTDHDPRRRATSVGPYTSRLMTERLEEEVRAKAIQVLDGLLVVRILHSGGRVLGLLCLDLTSAGTNFTAICCTNIVWATGGPAGMYADSVYPYGHYGSTGLALEAGAMGQNLTEWQFGLASVKPRWNVSGTYMQALPRFVSTNADGDGEREFLLDHFLEKHQMLDNVFLKGYQWPFDVRRVAGGSSIIDLLVFLEVQKGRRVFLDFRTNPGGIPIDFTALSAETREYLEKAGACFGSPFDRLARMNAPAVDFYRDNGVNLAEEMLEIRLCAQHNNGGIAVDAWWHSSVKGFFAAGEAAGTHGVYRPGGSALNAGQVGALRCARYIAAHRNTPPDTQGWPLLIQAQVDELLRYVPSRKVEQGSWCPREEFHAAAARMSLAAGAIRDEKEISAAMLQAGNSLQNLPELAQCTTEKMLPWVFRLRDMLLCQVVYLGAMLDYIRQGGRSRGSALYTDPAGQSPGGTVPDRLRFQLEDGTLGRRIQQALWSNGQTQYLWRNVRPIPKTDDFFENVWREFRENGGVS